MTPSPSGDLSCHIGEDSPGTELFCPSDKNEPLSLGMPLLPQVTASLIYRYFRNPVLEEVPKHNRYMQKHLDSLLGMYCDRSMINFDFKEQRFSSPSNAILDKWVAEYLVPFKLDYAKICSQSISRR